MNTDIFSVRMHASRQGGHISGAERLCRPEELDAVALALLHRALAHEKGRPDQVRLAVDPVALADVEKGPLPGLRTWQVADFKQGRRAACSLLVQAAVDPEAAVAAMASLAAGAAPEGGNMRGAMLIDARTGERLEHDLARGVRVSRMDLEAEARQNLKDGLAPLGLDNAHVREAMVLAAKVVRAPGVVAELCWSDDPSYEAGYVASSRHGYQRITRLKPVGEELGGRAFFIDRDRTDLQALVHYLERSAFLATEVGELSGPKRWEG